MSGRSSGSGDVWIDETLETGSTTWVDPTSVLDPLEDTSVHEGSLQQHPFDGEAHLFDLEQYSNQCWEGDTWVEPGVEGINTVKDASDELANLLLGKYDSGKWFATDICKVAWWATRIGGVGALAELAKRPGLQTGNYNQHIEHVLGTSKNDVLLSYLNMPSSGPTDGSRTMRKLPVIHPYELLNQEMAECREQLESSLATAVRDDLLPPVYTEHPVAISSGLKAHPIALYLDGVPTTKRDGVLGVWTYFLHSPKKKRHLCAVIKKSTLCACGCGGWCSLFVLFAWLGWNMGVMAAGKNPLTAWDGSAFNDYIRASPSVAGMPLLYIACLCAIKGDWQEFCSTFAFANWATIASPCFSCWATKLDYLLDQALKFRETAWPDFTMEDYLLACESCEVSVTVTSLAVLRAIRAALFYDKRQTGARGRALDGMCLVRTPHCKRRIVWSLQ